jgi:hypothetical protein
MVVALIAILRCVKSPIGLRVGRNLFIHRTIDTCVDEEKLVKTLDDYRQTERSQRATLSRSNRVTRNWHVAEQRGVLNLVTVARQSCDRDAR